MVEVARHSGRYHVSFHSGPRTVKSGIRLAGGSDRQTKTEQKTRSYYVCFHLPFMGGFARSLTRWEIHFSGKVRCDASKNSPLFEIAPRARAFQSRCPRHRKPE